MTEANEPSSHTEPSTSAAPLVDHALTKLVAIFNHSPRSHIGVTLTVSGLVVSGLLVSGTRYFELLDESLSDSGILALWGPERELYRVKSSGEESFDLLPEVARTSFIHLADAQVHEGGRAIGLKIWRGRLAEVTGWSMGSLTTPDADFDD